MITATGTMHGRDVTLTLDAGVLSGDQSAIDAVRVAISESVDVYIAGVTGGPAALDTDMQAAATFMFVLDDGSVRLNTDTVPEVIPEGAVA